MTATKRFVFDEPILLGTRDRPEGEKSRARTMQEAAGILLVEDNADDAELTILGFRKRGIESPVRVMRGGAEALEHHFGSGPGAG